MLAIKIADSSNMPDDIFSNMKSVFEKDAKDGIFPSCAALSIETGESHQVGFISNLEKLPNGDVIVGIAVGMEMNIETDSGRILGVLIKSLEGDGAENG